MRRIVQIGAVGPTPTIQYSAELSYVDDVMTVAMAELQSMWSQPASADPEAHCRRLWEALRPIYVVNPADVHTLDGWQRCHLSNERGAAQYFGQTILPSYIGLSLTPGDVAPVTMPVLSIHRRKDRSAPYGGGCDWARLLSNARLLTVEEAGHMPWIAAPDEVLSAIDHFLR